MIRRTRHDTSSFASKRGCRSSKISSRTPFTMISQSPRPKTSTLRCANSAKPKPSSRFSITIIKTHPHAHHTGPVQNSRPPELSAPPPQHAHMTHLPFFAELMLGYSRLTQAPFLNFGSGPPHPLYRSLPKSITLLPVS